MLCIVMTVINVSMIMILLSILINIQNIVAKSF